MKKFVMYKIHRQDVAKVREELETDDLIKMFRFAPCTATEKQRTGFSPTPFGDYVTTMEDGTLLLNFTTQNKTLNKNEVEHKKQEVFEAYIKEMGVTLEEYNEASDKVKRDAEKFVKEEAEYQVLKTTFPNEPKHALIAIRKDGYIFSEGNWNAAEKGLSAIRSAIGSLPAVAVQYDISPSDLMKQLILDRASDVITLGYKTILESEDKGKFTVAKESAYDEKIKKLIDDGCTVLGLELEFDGVVSALMRDGMVFDAVKFDDMATVESDDEEADAQGNNLITLDLIFKFGDEMRKRLEEVNTLDTE